MDLAPVVDAAAEAGIPLERLAVGNQPGVVPSGPSGRWAVFPLEDGTVGLGGLDRGGFAPYGRYHDPDAVLNALRHVFQSPVDLAEVDVPRLAAEAQALAGRLKQRPVEDLSAADLPVGTALDQIGPDSGYCLFLLDTPFSQRSSPPTDLELPRRGYLLRRPLPPTVRVSPVVPWFGQPGGGIMVLLDRPVRWYYDTGHVDAFAVV